MTESQIFRFQTGTVLILTAGLVDDILEIQKTGRIFVLNG